jgi:hypothetical protein
MALVRLVVDLQILAVVVVVQQVENQVLVALVLLLFGIHKSTQPQL